MSYHVCRACGATGAEDTPSHGARLRAIALGWSFGRYVRGGKTLRGRIVLCPKCSQAEADRERAGAKASY